MSPAIGQEAPETRDAPEAAPAAIPMAVVTPRAEELAANLRRIEALIEPSAEVAAIEEAVSERADTFVELRRELDELDTSEVSVRMLEDHRLAWTEHDAMLADGLSGLQERWESLTYESEELDATKRRWSATRESAVAEDAPAEMRAHIDTQLERIAEVEAKLEERGVAVAAVLARVSRSREVALEGLARLSDVARDIRQRLWIQNAPPLWRWTASTEGSSLSEEAANAHRYWLETLVRFVSARRGQFLFLAALFVGFLLMGEVAKRRSSTWPAENPELDAARFVVSRPISMAVAFTLALTVFVLDNRAGAISDLIVLVAVAPFIRLGIGLCAPIAHSALYSFGGLLLLNQFWSLTPDGSFLRRLLHFGVTALALAVVAGLVARWRSAEETRLGRWWSFAWVFLATAGMALAVSLIANILGWTNLAQLLTDGTIGAAFSGLAWAVVVLALKALAPVVTRSQLGVALPSLSRHSAMFTRGTYRLAAATAFVLWIRSLLWRFQLLEPAAEKLRTMLAASISIGGLEVSVGRVLASIFILIATWLLGRMARFVLREEMLPRVRLPEGADHSVVSVINYLIWGSGLVLSAAAAGLSGTQLTVVFGALGVGIGFGLQSIVNNFVSGLILIFERPIKVGDRVQTASYFGIVTSIGIRASTIRTFDGADVVVPNGDLVAKEFVNWTRTDRTRRAEVLVRVALGTDPKEVLTILRRVASEQDKILENPEPTALMTGFGESSLDFRLLVWTRIEDHMSVASELHVEVNDELKRAGIRIPIPQRDLHVRAADSEKLEDVVAETTKS